MLLTWRLVGLFLELRERIRTGSFGLVWDQHRLIWSKSTTPPRKWYAHTHVCNVCIHARKHTHAHTINLYPILQQIVFVVILLEFRCTWSISEENKLYDIALLWKLSMIFKLNTWYWTRTIFIFDHPEMDLQLRNVVFVGHQPMNWCHGISSTTNPTSTTLYISWVSINLYEAVGDQQHSRTLQM